MSWFSSFIHGAGQVVHDVVKGVGHAVGDVIHVVGKNIVPIVAAIAAYYTAGLSEAAVGGAAAAGAATTTASAGAVAGSLAATDAATAMTMTAAEASAAAAAAGITASSAAAGGITGWFAEKAAAVEAGVAFVSHKLAAPVAEVQKLSDAYNKDIFQPIIKPLTTFYDKAKSLYSAVHDSLAEGLQGMLEVPVEIAKSFGGLAAINRHIADVRIEGSATIANSILVPGIARAAHEDLSQLHETISNYTKLPENPLLELGEINLSEPENYSPAVEKAQSIIKAINAGDTWLDKAAAQVLGLLYAGPFWLENLKPPLEQLKQHVNSVTPMALLGLGEIVEGIKRGELNDAQAHEEALKHGIDGTRLNVLVELSRKLIDTGSLIDGFYRHIVTAQDLETELAKQGYDESRIGLLTELALKLPSPGDAMQWSARAGLSEGSLDDLLLANRLTPEFIELFKKAAFAPPGAVNYTRSYSRIKASQDGYLAESLGQKAPPDIAEIHRQNLQSPESADLSWVAHWQDMSIGDWINAYFRGLTTRDELSLAFDSHNYPQELQETAIEVGRELIPIWLAPNILGTGLVNDEDGRAMLTKLGLDSANVDLMVEYGKAKANGPIAAQTDTLHQMSLSNLKQLYDQGIIDINMYKDGLVAHGYTIESATLLVELEHAKLKLKERKANGEQIVNEVKRGLITPETAQNRLYDEGFSTGEVNKYMIAINRNKINEHKIPGEAVLAKMFKTDIINDAEWREAMAHHGYSNFWIDKLIQTL